MKVDDVMAYERKVDNANCYTAETVNGFDRPA